jgi:hypothetical protein
MTKLPAYLVLNSRTGNMHFEKSNQSDEINKWIGCDRLELLPVKRDLSDQYMMYVDEEGMHKEGIGMNVLVNPFMDQNTLLYYARIGGPRGNAVVYRKGGHSEKELLRLFEEADEEDEDEEYLDLIKRTIQSYREGKINC